MGKNKDKIQNSEFEEKLRESRLKNQQQQEGTPASKPDAQPSEDNDGSYKTIPVIEEEVKIGKKIVESDQVYVTKHVYDEEVTVDVPTIHEQIEVERVPINEYIEDAPPAVRHEGDTMIVPVLREESVVVKRLVLVEELRITKRKVEEHNPQQVTLQKEEVLVNRANDSNPREEEEDRDL